MKTDRHTTTEVICGTCGNPFQARTERVEAGLGKYCSKICFDVWQRENRKSDKHGKENAKMYPNKKNGGFFVQWYENGRPVNSPWHKWAWEMNFGEVPKGHVVEYKDGNKNNASLDNLQLRRTRQGKKLLPKKKKDFSLEHRNKISENNIRLWKFQP
jgi:hypothetical protein